MADESQVNPEQQRGLFTGFEHFATPTEADYRAVISDGLVVLDTNALLNLYRYSLRPRKALLEILAKIGDHLWEPQQVMVEFWRNREKALQNYSSASSAFEKRANSAKDQTVKAINECAKRFGIDVQQRKILIAAIEKAYESLSSSVNTLVASDGTMNVGRDTGSDSVLTTLDIILRGRVGAPYDADRYKAAIVEARHRIDAQIPPAFKDSSKEPGRAEGDYLVWSQMLDEAAQRQTDVLFVTGDVKEDWWRDAGSSKQVGPRMELLQEFRDKTSARLFMLQPADFLDKAGSIMQVSIAAESVEQAREVDLEQQNWPNLRLAQGFEVQISDVLLSPEFRENLRIRPTREGSGIDFTIRRSNSSVVGVKVFYSSIDSGVKRIYRAIDSAEQFLSRNPRHASVLFITNQDIDNLVLRSGRFTDKMNFFVWNGMEDSPFLYFTIRDMVGDADEAISAGPLF